MRVSSFLLAAALLAGSAFGQNMTVRGQVADQSGAVIQGATVTLSGAGGYSRTAVTAGDGSYLFSDVPVGGYTLQVTAPGLVLREPAKVAARPGLQTVNLVMYVAGEKQQLTVDEGTKPAIGTDAGGNASAVVMRGADLDALADNPDDLAADLEALAGPAAGPGGASFFIDGFSGGQLPPKNAIREIRINQNPFSPEYDRLGFARVEIFTKPGSDKFHADVGYNFANEKWNSRNPYAARKAPFRLNEFRNTFSGPLGKRASFNLVLTREYVDNGNAVNGVILDPQTLLATAFTDTPVAALRRTVVSPRVDYQLTSNHTLSARYSYSRDIVRNAGTGSLNLAERGYHFDSPTQTIQITETAVLGAAVVNETRFQYFHPRTISQANSNGFALQVLGAFHGGGNPLGRTTTTQNNYEFHNNTSVLRGPHTWRFGARLRAVSEAAVSPQNFAGTFIFSGGLAPVLDAAGNPQAAIVNISSIESYRRNVLFRRMGLPPAQIRQLGGGASQFSIAAGEPYISGSQFDVGAFVADDWKVRGDFTVSIGLRYETQTNMHDWRDFAPRVGLAWAPGSAGKSRPKNVIRAGFGMFYDRFSLGNTLTARRYNGVTQQQYVVTNPDFFPDVPPIPALAGPAAASTIHQVSRDLRAPYLMQSAVSFERQLLRDTTVAVTYANTHGLHLFRSEDVNPPLPGTYAASVPGGGVFPLGRPGLVALMESTGVYNQHQLIVNVNTKFARDISLNGSYMYNRAMSNTDGLGTFPANPYSMEGEYGPAATDMHHRLSLAGTVTIPRLRIRLNPLLTANTGPPFDITSGTDVYGDTLFNARPGLAVDTSKPGVIATKYGLLDPRPAPGQKLLPRNFGRGPGQIMLNLRVGRTFTFGGAGEGSSSAAAGPSVVARDAPQGPFATAGGSAAAPSSGRRYSVTISMQVRNLTNHNNRGPIIGTITSPLFGQANQPAGSGSGIFSESANNRRLELQTRFTF